MAFQGHRAPAAHDSLDAETHWVHTGFHMVERDRRLSIRIAEEEWTMLHALAEREGVSASDYIRLFIRRTHAETLGSAKPKKPKR